MVHRGWIPTGFVLVLGVIGLLPSSAHAFEPSGYDAIEAQVHEQFPQLPQAALDQAFGYLESHPDQVTNTNYMTIVNFDQPSTDERMYVIDLKSAVGTTYLVAHGKNSGENYATQFSNEVNSEMSSLGIYLTGETYVGDHGLSLRLRGMEATNSNAEAREIVLHGAAYVSEDFIKQYGRLGRSLGCLAVGLQYSTDLSTKLANGSIVLAYHSPQN